MAGSRGSLNPELLRRLGLWLGRLLVGASRWWAERLPIWRWAKIFFRASFLPEQNYLIVLAVVVGILTGFGSVGFIYLLEQIAAFAVGPVASLLDVFGPANLVLLPAVGGLMAGEQRRANPQAGRLHQGHQLVTDDRFWRDSRTRGADGADRVGHRIGGRQVDQA